MKRKIKKEKAVKVKKITHKEPSVKTKNINSIKTPIIKETSIVKPVKKPTRKDVEYTLIKTIKEIKPKSDYIILSNPIISFETTEVPEVIETKIIKLDFHTLATVSDYTIVDVASADCKFTITSLYSVVPT